VIETTAAPIVSSFRVKSKRRISSLTVSALTSHQKDSNRSYRKQSLQNRSVDKEDTDKIITIEVNPSVIYDDDEDEYDEYSVVEVSLMEFTIEETIFDEIIKEEEDESTLATVVSDSSRPYFTSATTTVVVAVVSPIEQKIVNILENDLWSVDCIAVAHAMKRLMKYCHPSVSNSSILREETLTTIVQYGGIHNILQSIERWSENGLISFLGCTILEGLLLVSTTTAAASDKSMSNKHLKNLLLELQALPLLMQVMNDQYNRHIAAYQSARWLISRL
jgi:hypothetical protein